VFRKGDSKKKKDLQKELGLIYHGHTPSNTASYAALAFEGQSPFHDLYVTVATSSGNERHVPVSFTRDPSSNLVAGQTFTLQMLKQATLTNSAARPITAMSLWNRVDEIHKNCKKAMAFVKEKINPDGTFASGTNNADDLWDHVLDKMYEYTAQDTTANHENDDEDDFADGNDEEGVNDASGDAPGTRPKTWYFRGFWTLQLFGPLAQEKEKSSLLNVDSLDSLVQSRASIRAENAKEKSSKRMNQPQEPSTVVDLSTADSPSGFKCGMPMRDKSAIVHLAQQQVAASARADELEFETISRSMDAVKDELNFSLTIVSQLGIKDKEDDAWKRVFELQKQFAEKNKELLDFQARKRLKREEEAKKGSMFDSLLRSVNRNFSMPSSVSTNATPSAESALSDAST
jgi:hypothetical protein